MLENEKYLSKDETNLRIAKIIVWGFLGIAFIFFTSMSGCAMYLDSTVAEQTRAKTEQIKEKAKIEKEKIDAVSALIAQGINPLAARCAIMGYTMAIQMGKVYNPCAQFLNKVDNQGEEPR